VRCEVRHVTHLLHGLAQFLHILKLLRHPSIATFANDKPQSIAKSNAQNICKLITSTSHATHHPTCTCCCRCIFSSSTPNVIEGCAVAAACTVTKVARREKHCKKRGKLSRSILVQEPERRICGGRGGWQMKGEIATGRSSSF
jgi:hypothetical protein